MDRVCTFMYKGKPLVEPGETAYVAQSTNPPKVVQAVVESLEITEEDVYYRFVSLAGHAIDRVFVDSDSAWQFAYGRYYEQLKSAVEAAQERLDDARKQLEEVRDAINKEVWRDERMS